MFLSATRKTQYPLEEAEVADGMPVDCWDSRPDTLLSNTGPHKSNCVLHKSNTCPTEVMSVLERKSSAHANLVGPGATVCQLPNVTESLSFKRL